MADVQDRYATAVEPFGGWLLKQTNRPGWISDLAKAAKADRGFPKAGDVAAVRKWLEGQRASGDDWEALEDAENAYSAFAEG